LDEQQAALGSDCIQDCYTSGGAFAPCLPPSFCAAKQTKPHPKSTQHSHVQGCCSPVSHGRFEQALAKHKRLASLIFGIPATESNSHISQSDMSSETAKLA